MYESYNSIMVLILQKILVHKLETIFMILPTKSRITKPCVTREKKEYISSNYESRASQRRQKNEKIFPYVFSVFMVYKL